MKKIIVTIAAAFAIVLGTISTASASTGEMPAVPMPQGPDCVSWLNYGPLYFDWEAVEEGCNLDYGVGTVELSYVRWLEAYVQNYTEFQPVQEEWMDSQDEEIAAQHDQIVEQRQIIRHQRQQIRNLRHRLANS